MAGEKQSTETAPQFIAIDRVVGQTHAQTAVARQEWLILRQILLAKLTRLKKLFL